MNDNYILMHKKDACGIVAIDHDNGALIGAKIKVPQLAPFLGNADERLMKIWWEHRAVPGSRKDMQAIFRKAGCENSKEYLAKNLALSLTDTYWICPIDAELSWDDVNLHNIKLQSRRLAYHNANTYDPNASLSGEMDKYWDLSGKRPVMIKRASSAYGQQSVNEFFASELHSRQNTTTPFVRYRQTDSEDNSILSACDSFTTEDIEFVPAFEILQSEKTRNNKSGYDKYIDICVRNGIDREVMQKHMDYMTLTDFVISNTDRHMYNFGILRNSETMEFIAPAPIFDSGNSMFYGENGTIPLGRKELLSLKINSFHKTEEKMLTHIKDKNALKYDVLPKKETVMRFYESYGIPKERAAFISGSYANKLELLNDFLRGEKISLYYDRHKYKPVL